MSHYNCPAYGSLRTYPAYRQPRCWSIIECPSGNHIFAINSYDTLKLKTFDNRISISGNACEKTITFDLNTDVSFNNIDVDGDALITGKLTVGGLIDPTGLVLEHQAAAPHTNTGTQGTLWVNGNDLKFTDSTAATITLGAGGGGGGGGGVDSKWKERTFASSKWLEPSGTDISGIICGNVLIEEFLLVEKKFFAGGPMESPLLQVLPVSEGTPNGVVVVVGPLNCGPIGCENLWCGENLDVSGNLTVEGSQVDVCGNLAVGGNIKCESLDVSGGRIRYSVGNNWVHSGGNSAEDIPSTHAVVQVSGGTAGVGGSSALCDIDDTSAVPGQILTIVVPASKELSFASATNVVQPAAGGGVIAKGGTSVQFVFLAGKWYPLGLYPPPPPSPS